MRKTDAFEKKIGYGFKDKDILKKALTHSSYAYEHISSAIDDNELLEFLGDSVIGLITAEFFFAAFPDRQEGELSKLKASVSSTVALALLAEKIKLDKHILLGRGEEKSGGRKKKTILAGAFEALVGGIYLDGGFESAQAFLTPLLTPSLKSLKRESFHINNFKSALQEHFQKDNLEAPSYRIVSEKGPEHKKTFVVEVRYENRTLAKATGSSKKIAEQRAAQKALKIHLGRKMKALSPGTFIVEGGFSKTPKK